MRANAIYNEFVYGGHLLALGTASIAGSAALVLGRLPTLDLAAMAYLFTNGAYTINRASEADQDEVSHPQRTAYLRRRRAYLPAIAAAYMLFTLQSAAAYWTGRGGLWKGRVLAPPTKAERA